MVALSDIPAITHIEPGYYWFRHEEGTTFIALLDSCNGRWYVPGVHDPINLTALLDHSDFMGKVRPLEDYDGSP